MADLRFIALPGSLRQASYARAIAASLDELAPDDVAVELLGTLGDLPLYNQDIEDAGMPAAAVEMAAIISTADALVIVTPEYNHSTPGVLKNALDWLSRFPARPLEHKPVAIQSASPGKLGGARAQEHVRQVLVAMNAWVLNEPEVIVTQVADKVDVSVGAITDRETRQQISRQLEALAGRVRSPTKRAA